MSFPLKKTWAFSWDSPFTILKRPSSLLPGTRPSDEHTASQVVGPQVSTTLGSASKSLVIPLASDTPFSIPKLVSRPSGLIQLKIAHKIPPGVSAGSLASTSASPTIMFGPGLRMLSHPPFPNGAEWIKTVVYLKNRMRPEIRLMDPSADFCNNICRLCCHPLALPFHPIAFAPCCGQPAGRACLAISLYHDARNECAFCYTRYPRFMGYDEEPQTPSYPIVEDMALQKCAISESHFTFNSTKEVFTVGHLPDDPYLGKSYKDWSQTCFPPAAEVDASTKEIFDFLR